MATRRHGIAQLLLVSLATLAAGWSAAHAAEKFPVKPVRMIVPYAPGGATDITARQPQSD